jgi:hypothetical protein
MLNVWKYEHLSENLASIGHLFKLCSLCENMSIWMKINFHWSFVWNMLNVWKYGHLIENLTFIGYLCKICSMCENMVIWVKIWLSLVICVKYAQCVKMWPIDALCSISEALYSVSDGHYWKWIVFYLWWKKKGDALYGGVSHIWSKWAHTLSRHISHIKYMWDTLWGYISLLLPWTKMIINRIFSSRSSLHLLHHAHGHTCAHMYYWHAVQTKEGSVGAVSY